MISQLTGTIVTTNLDGVVIDVNGVGMSVLCAPSTIAELRLNAKTTLQTALVVREDALTLYGFRDSDERTIWQLLQTVSGIGPKVALAFLAVLAPDEIRAAIADADLATLTTVPGVGKKTGERIVVELKDRVGVVSAAAAVGTANWKNQVQEALVGLGWSLKEADKAISAVAADDSIAKEDVPALLRRALQTMARKS